MDSYSKIKIRNNEIYVDDKKISGVRRIDLFLSAESIPMADVQIALDSTADFEGIGNASLRFTPDTISDAAKSIIFAMKLDPELKKAMVASVISALTENKDAPLYETASAVVDRVFDLEEFRE